MIEHAKIRAIIVDDEPVGRLAVQDGLASHPEVDIVKECVDGYEAMEAVHEYKPDLMFLDEEMPEIDGFEVVRQLGKDHCPLVIILTAYPKYALDAYDIDPVHFLTKPIDQARFDEALERVKSRLMAHRLSILATSRTAPRYRQRLCVNEKEGRRIVIQVREVAWFKAHEKYVEIHWSQKLPYIRQQIGTLEASLDPEVFVRIDRSFIVNLDKIREFGHLGKKHWVIFSDKSELEISETGRKNLEDRLQNFPPK